jgi:hypothetical protein
MMIFGSMGLCGYRAMGGTLLQVRDPLHVLLRIPQKTELAGLDSDENKCGFQGFRGGGDFGVRGFFLHKAPAWIDCDGRRDFS